MTTFATETLKQASYRMAYVRLTPARYVVDDLANEGGGIYSMTFSFPVVRVERNGVAISSTVSNPPGSNDQYYANEASSTFKVKLAAAPSASNIIVVYYYIFISTSALSAPTLPTDTIGFRVWEPRIINSPEVSLSMSDVITGVFSLSSGTLEIANSDRWFNQFLTANDSFKNKDIAVWFAINDVGGNAQKVFRGTMTSVNLGSDSVSIGYSDGFASMQRPAYMGDSYLEAYFRRETGSFPTMNPAQNGMPCRYIVGWSSRYQQIASDDAVYTYQDSVGTGDQIDQYYEDAVCTNYTQAIGTSANRVWGLCRIKAGKLKTQTFGSITRVYSHADAIHYYIKFSGHNLKVGETVKWTEAAVVYYGQVVYNTAFTYSGNSYDCAIVAATGGTAMSTSSTFTSQSGVALYWYDASATAWRTLYSTRDYTTSTSSTTGGNDYVQITLVNNFEANFGAAAIDPSTDYIKWRVFQDVSSNAARHATILGNICTAAGLTKDAVTFDAVGSSLAVDCMFSMPNCDETEYRSYLEYAQDLLGGTLGFIAMNDLEQVEYHLLDTPSSTNSRDANLCLANSVECAVEYQDVITEVIASNPHNVAQRVLDDTNGPSISRTSLKAKYLHGIDASLSLRHPLENIGLRIDAIINLRSNRRALYQFKTSTIDLTTELGDDLQLETNLLGTATSDDLTVIGYQRGLDSTTITATDLEGL